MAIKSEVKNDGKDRFIDVWVLGVLCDTDNIRNYCLTLTLCVNGEKMTEEELLEQFSLSEKAKNVAVNLLSEADKIPLACRKPARVAAAVYIACALVNERRTQEEICKLANIHTTTIRRCYKEFVNKLDALVEYRS